VRRHTAKNVLPSRPPQQWPTKLSPRTRFSSKRARWLPRATEVVGAGPAPPAAASPHRALHVLRRVVSALAGRSGITNEALYFPRHVPLWKPGGGGPRDPVSVAVETPCPLSQPPVRVVRGRGGRRRPAPTPQRRPRRSASTSAVRRWRSWRLRSGHTRPCNACVVSAPSALSRSHHLRPALPGLKAARRGVCLAVCLAAGNRRGA
jgi:hypothetical protein